MLPFRRSASVLHFVCTIVALPMLCCASFVHAAWPDKPIKILVPFPPGGASDLVARTIADKLAARFTAGVLVENRPGAGGTIATAEMLKQPKDGYTIMTGTMGTHAIAPSLYKSLSFDPLRAGTAVSTASTTGSDAVIEMAANALRVS